MSKSAMPGRNVTMQDVADHAGVSMKSVSRVVNNEPSVSKKLRVKVEASIAELNFKPNVHARYMAKARSNLIGFPLPALSASFFSHILDTALELCKGTPYNILTYPMRRDDYHSSESITGVLEQMRVSSNIEAILLPPPFSSDVKVTQWLEDNNVPFACVGQISEVKSLIHTTTNIESGMYDATQYVIDAGHCRIGYISGPEHLLPVAERKRGFLRALESNGIQPDPALILKGDFQFPKALVSAKTLLTLPQRPTAIICSNDITAFAVLQVANQMGIKVPEDLSVTGFDDIPEADMSMVPLTTVRQPVEEMTLIAVQTLLSYLQTGEVVKYESMCTNHLVIRRSVAPVN